MLNLKKKYLLNTIYFDLNKKYIFKNKKNDLFLYLIEYLKLITLNLNRNK